MRWVFITEDVHSTSRLDKCFRLTQGNFLHNLHFLNIKQVLW